MTIAGVSVVVGQALVAAFGDSSRFRFGDAAAGDPGLATRPVNPFRLNEEERGFGGCTQQFRAFFLCHEINVIPD